MHGHAFLRWAVILVLGVGLSGCVSCSADYDDDGFIDPSSLQDGGWELPDGSPVILPRSDCEWLVWRTCGLRDGGAAACEHSGACEAAKLIEEFSPEACAIKLESPAYPPCDETSGCKELLLKCCGSLGGVGPCADSPSCTVAKEVAEQGRIEVCHEAMRDETTFARCTP